MLPERGPQQPGHDGEPHGGPVRAPLRAAAGLLRLAGTGGAEDPAAVGRPASAEISPVTSARKLPWVRGSG